MGYHDTVLNFNVVERERTAACSSIDPEQLARISDRAFELTLEILEARGNVLSQAHLDYLRQACWFLTRMAHRTIRGRYVLDLATGLGKTTLLVCWTKAMVEAGADWSVAICAARVQELEDLRQELMTGPSPVPEGEIGLWHAKDDAETPPTYCAPEREKYGTRRVLLLTHSRMRRGQEVAPWLRYRGQPRDLVVYDESLVATGVWEVSYARLVGQMKEVRARLDHRGKVAGLLARVSDQLDEEVRAQGCRASPRAFALPRVDLMDRQEVITEVGRHLGDGSDLERFLRNRDAAFRVLIIKNDGGHATVIRTFPTVPDELDGMVVLDASYRLRTLSVLANERLHEDARRLRLRVAGDDAGPDMHSGFKRFDQVRIHLMPTRRSGRTFVARDLELDDDPSTIAAEVASVVAELPRGEAVLIWTFLRQGGMPDFRGRLLKALKRAGVDPDAQVEVDGTMRPRVVIETFGRETATSAYRYCRHVLFTGCLELPRQNLAAQFVAETRDLTAEISGDDVDRLIRGDIWHRIYQALSRAACRDVWVDDQGRTQAKPTDVWLFTRHHQHIREELGPSLPGVRWEVWKPRYMKDDVISKEHLAATLIGEILGKLDRDRISCRELKKTDSWLDDLPRSTFQRARDRALEANPEWLLEGSSFTRTRSQYPKPPPPEDLKEAA